MLPRGNLFFCDHTSAKSAPTTQILSYAPYIQSKIESLLLESIYNVKILNENVVFLPFREEVKLAP